MRRRLLASGALLVAVLLIAAVPAAAKKSGQLLEFGSMIGVPKPLTGAAGTIRNLPGGGLPWVIDQGKGELSADGHLEIKVKGLVIDPNDPDAIARGLAGTNPSPTFRAVVSCLGADGSVQNAATDPFPASADGNARIEATLTLASPCIAPIVFVTSPTLAWFATTGG